MSINLENVRRVTPNQVIKLFADGGQTITVEQANKVLEFMYMLAEVTLEVAEKEILERDLLPTNMINPTV